MERLRELFRQVPIVVDHGGRDLLSYTVVDLNVFLFGPLRKGFVVHCDLAPRLVVT